MLGGQLNFERGDGRAAELTGEYCGSLSQPVPVAAAASLSQLGPVAAAASAMAGAVTSWSCFCRLMIVGVPASMHN